VVACFDNKETVIGPFVASEFVTTADGSLRGFLVTSQKHERTKDIFGERRAAHCGRKSRNTHNSSSSLCMTAFLRWLFLGSLQECWEKEDRNQGLDQQRVYGERKTQCGPACFLVLPEWLLREAPELGLTAAHQFSAGELSGNEHNDYGGWHADCERLVA
jgi:hypothetical protein